MKLKLLFSLVALAGLLGLTQNAEAGRRGGSMGTHGWLRMNHTLAFDNISFPGGRVVDVDIAGDGAMRLEIYDQDGHLVVSRNTTWGPMVSQCRVFWRPRQSGHYTIKIVNLDDHDIQYGVGIN